MSDRSVTIKFNRFFWSIMCLILVAAKAFGFLDISWWLVFLPLFVPLILTGLFLIFIFLISYAEHLFRKI